MTASGSHVIWRCLQVFTWDAAATCFGDSCELVKRSLSPPTLIFLGAYICPLPPHFICSSWLQSVNLSAASMTGLSTHRPRVPNQLIPHADSTLQPFLIRHRNRRPSMTPALRRNKSISAEYALPLPSPQNRSNTTTSPSMINSCTCPSFRTGAPSTLPWSIKPASTSTHYSL